MKHLVWILYLALFYVAIQGKTWSLRRHGHWTVTEEKFYFEKDCLRFIEKRKNDPYYVDFKWTCEKM